MIFLNSISIKRSMNLPCSNMLMWITRNMIFIFHKNGKNKIQFASYLLLLLICSSFLNVIFCRGGKRNCEKSHSDLNVEKRWCAMYNTEGLNVILTASLEQEPRYHIACTHTHTSCHCGDIQPCKKNVCL